VVFVVQKQVQELESDLFWGVYWLIRLEQPDLSLPVCASEPWDKFKPNPEFGDNVH